jgi:hypothetical protein
MDCDITISGFLAEVAEPEASHLAKSISGVLRQAGFSFAIDVRDNRRACLILRETDTSSIEFHEEEPGAPGVGHRHG